LGVALGSCIYLWDATTNKVCKFCDMAPQSSVTSIGWNPKGSQLAIGNTLGDV
jgi:cell division cycle 20-like protein 1 (cofactor of APC complex)